MNMKALCWRSSIAVMMVVMALIAAPPQASAEGNNSIVVPITDKVDGRTYGQWSAEWWHRAFAVTTLEDCNPMNQPEPNQVRGPVWFLAGTAGLAGGKATRTCLTIPAGKFIMFPVFNAEWSQAEARATLPPAGGCFILGVVPSGTNFAALNACAKAQVKQASGLTAVVDGVSLDLTNQEAASPRPLFPISVVENNPFCPLIPGPNPSAPTLPCPVTSNSAADGIWIILKPLSNGPHTLRLTATASFPDVVNPPFTPFTFTTDVTYTLMVQPAK